MKTFRLAHLSDLHFGTEVSAVAQAAVELLQELRPDLIVVTGDITQRATKKQFQAAREFLDQLQPIPMISIPGNHDIPLYNVFLRLLGPYNRYLKYFKGSLQGMYQESGVEVITLNSTQALRHIQGSLAVEYVEKALQRFQQDAVLRVVAFHHPMDCKKQIDEKNLLIRSQEIMEILSKYKVDLVLGGHIHDPVTRLSSERYPKILKPFVLSVGGTCTSYRVRRDAPNSFNTYDVVTSVDANVKINFTRHKFESSHQHFSGEDQQVFVRSVDKVWAST